MPHDRAGMFQSLFLWNALVEEKPFSGHAGFWMFQSLFLWNALVESQGIRHRDARGEVSILVFMECARRALLDYLRLSSGYLVSILVFMECARREF